MNALPSGTVTFLFTDIEGSTRLFQQHPEAMKDALARHHALLQDAIGAHRGHVFQVAGRRVLLGVRGRRRCARRGARRAARAAPERWGEVGAVRVRMGLHTGTAEARGGEYDSSLTLARAQRVMAAGHGGQTLLSSAAAEPRPRRAARRARRCATSGAHKLRGLAEAENHLPVRRRRPAVGVSAAARRGRRRVVGRAACSNWCAGSWSAAAAKLQQLQQHWDNAQQARGQLVLLSGEPGVGKTRLAQDLIAHAQKSGATMLRGGCYEYEATTPYLPFVEAFREWTRRQSPEQLRTALGATAPEIAKFAPEIEAKLGALTPNAPLSPSEERLRLFDNAARFLQSLAAERGLLVFIDDVHWADQGTLSLLHYLLRHLRNDRVLFLVAYREIELDRAHPLASALVEWNRERLGNARGARPPDARRHRHAAGDAVRRGKACPTSSSSALYRETEGNPFFIEEVIKSLIEQGQIYRDGDALGPQGDARAGDSAEREGGDRAAAHPAERADGGRAAHGGRARQDLPVPGTGRRVAAERGRAARRARRGERGAAHPREQRRRRARRPRAATTASRSRTTRSAKCSTRS